MGPQDHLQLEALLDSVRRIAAAAGEAIMDVYGTGIEVELKGDRSPLTEADRASHGIIGKRLAELNPRLPVLSEESAAGEIEARRGWQRYWLVDPLDGTKEFIKRNGEFTVNIALISRHRAVLGVVLAPALGVEYSGTLGIGAFKRERDGSKGPIEVAGTASDPVRVVGSRSHPSAALGAFLTRTGPHELKPMGSSLKICLVADGQADVYPRLGPTSEWDTAAAQAILESAGGCMIDIAGQALRYNTKEDLINPHFLAFGDRTRDWLSAIHSE